MQSEVLTQRHFSVAETARRCPEVEGRRPDPSTIFRWLTKGLHGVRLRHIRVGRRIAIPDGALEEFMQSLAATITSEHDAQLNNGPAPLPRLRSEKARNKSIAAAREIVARAGI